MKEIRIYVEGGGSGNGRALFRNGFKQFLKEQDEHARNKNIRLQVIPCGGRDSTIEDFKHALMSHPDACNMLLIDSEGVLDQSVFHSFKSQHRLTNLPDAKLHFMVELMEAWYLADIESLREYYGAELRVSSFPRNQNIEAIAKHDVENALKIATRPTSKGEYQKINHSHKILSLLQASRIRPRAENCQRFFVALEQEIQNS